MAVSGITCVIIFVCSFVFNFTVASSYCYKNWTLNTDGIDEDKININFGSRYIPDHGLSLFWTWKADGPSSLWSCRFWYSPLTNKTSGGFMYRNKAEKISTYLMWRNISGCMKWNTKGSRHIEQPAWNITTCQGDTWGFVPGNSQERGGSYFHVGNVIMTWGETTDCVTYTNSSNTTRPKRQTETFPEAPTQPRKAKTFGEWMKEVFQSWFGRNGRGDNFMTRAVNWFVSLFNRNTTGTNTTSRSYPGQGGFAVPGSDPDAEVIPVGEGRNDVESLTEETIPKRRYPPKRLY